MSRMLRLLEVSEQVESQEKDIFEAVESLRCLVECETLPNYTIVRAQVMENSTAQLLFYLAVAFKGEPKHLPVGTPNLVLPLIETEDFLLSSSTSLTPTSLINALLVYTSDNSPVLSLNNSRLVNYKQLSHLGHTPYTLGIFKSTRHALLIDPFTSSLQNFIENSGISESAYSKNNHKPCELEKINKSQDIKWSSEKVEQARKNRERPGKALRMLEDALVLMPSNIPAYVMRAEIYLEKGNFKDAEAECAKIKKIDPNNEHALQISQKIKYKTGETTYEIRDKRMFNSGHEHQLIYANLKKLP